VITKKPKIDYEHNDTALTLNPFEVCDEQDRCGTFTKTHPDGWTISGKVWEDYFYWVNDFHAWHPTLGHVWGDFETEVQADSEEAFADFYSKHTPESWDYAEI
jgi:hypothetical protein